MAARYPNSAVPLGCIKTKLRLILGKLILLVRVQFGTYHQYYSLCNTTQNFQHFLLEMLPTVLRRWIQGRTDSPHIDTRNLTTKASMPSTTQIATSPPQLSPTCVQVQGQVAGDLHGVRESSEHRSHDTCGCLVVSSLVFAGWVVGKKRREYEGYWFQLSVAESQDIL